MRTIRDRARAEAERTWPRRAQGTYVNHSLIRNEMVRMAEWATGLAPSESEIEAAAIQIFVYDTPSNNPDEWPNLDEFERADYRGAARAALLAAREARTA